MSRNSVQSLQPWVWLGLPSLAVLAATLIFAAPFRVFGLGLPEPLFAMVLAFAWPVIRPSVLGPIALLLIGLFYDLFWGGPLGLWALVLIASYGLALGGRSLMAGQGGVVMAAWYVATCCLAVGIAFAIATMRAHEQPNLLAVIWQLTWTVALFPAAYWLVDRFEDADPRFR